MTLSKRVLALSKPPAASKSVGNIRNATNNAAKRVRVFRAEFLLFRLPPPQHV
ncbi:hypothetical protein [Campylobacter fetus]|uniref:hypothetical protein n=1 Tax=Campylobacter fetus TaxID=196 RepID=UPI001301157F|nr:hypothetical protein [Campylobacter fetus]